MTTLSKMPRKKKPNISILLMVYPNSTESLPKSTHIITYLINRRRSSRNY